MLAASLPAMAEKQVARGVKYIVVIDRPTGPPPEGGCITKIELLRVTPIRGNNPFDPMNPLGGVAAGAAEGLPSCGSCTPTKADYQDGTTASILIDPATCACQVVTGAPVTADRVVMVDLDLFFEQANISVVNAPPFNWERVSGPTQVEINFDTYTLVVRKTDTGERFKIMFRVANGPMDVKLTVVSITRVQ